MFSEWLIPMILTPALALAAVVIPLAIYSRRQPEEETPVQARSAAHVAAATDANEDPIPLDTLIASFPTHEAHSGHMPEALHGDEEDWPPTETAEGWITG